MILFEPKTGQPVQVHEMQVNNFLQQGYRTTNPFEVKLIAPQETVPTKPNAELLNVNSAPLKDLTEKLGLTTQQAKDVRDGRTPNPYTSVEDLIAKIPDIQWTTFTNLSYEV